MKYVYIGTTLSKSQEWNRAWLGKFKFQVRLLWFSDDVLYKYAKPKPKWRKVTLIGQ